MVSLLVRTWCPCCGASQISLWQVCQVPLEPPVLEDQETAIQVVSHDQVVSNLSFIS